MMSRCNILTTVSVGLIGHMNDIEWVMSLPIYTCRFPLQSSVELFY